MSMMSLIRGRSEISFDLECQNHHNLKGTGTLLFLSQASLCGENIF